MRDKITINNHPIKIRNIFLKIVLPSIIISRLVFYLLGVRYFSETIHTSWQFLDTWSLKNNFFESIGYLHIQPPLFNIYNGIGIILFPKYYAHFFHTANILLLIYSSYCLIFILVNLNIRNSIIILSILFFILSPTLVLYENWHFYTFTGMCLMLITIYFIFKSILLQKVYFGQFLLPVILCLTISFFHLIWFLGLVALYLFFDFKKKKIIVKFSLLGLLLIGGWYTKNKLIFNEFTSSTFFGGNISKIMCDIDEAGVQNTVDTINNILPYPFLSADKYKWILGGDYKIPQTYQDKEVLNNPLKRNKEINFNYYGYIEVYDKYKDYSFTYLKGNPSFYFQNVIKASLTFFQPSKNYYWLNVQDNYEKLFWYNVVLNVSFSECLVYFGYIRQDGILYKVLSLLPILTLNCMISLIGMIYLRRNYRFFNIKIITLQQRFTIYLIYIYSYIFFIGNLLELGENNRFRFYFFSGTIILLAMSFEYVLRMIKNRKLKYHD